MKPKGVYWMKQSEWIIVKQLNDIELKNNTQEVSARWAHPIAALLLQPSGLRVGRCSMHNRKPVDSLSFSLSFAGRKAILFAWKLSHTYGAF